MRNREHWIAKLLLLDSRFAFYISKTTYYVLIDYSYFDISRYGLYCKDVFSRPHLAIEMVTAMVIFGLIVYDILKVSIIKKQV